MTKRAGVLLISDAQKNVAVTNCCRVMAQQLERRGVAAAECTDPHALRGALTSGVTAHFNLHPDARLGVEQIKLARARHCPVLVTCHEFTRLRGPERKAEIVLALLAADHVVFTNRADHEAALAELPQLRGASRVIPVTSGAWVSDEDYTAKRRAAPAQLQNPEVLYAGMIEPIKGSERVVEAARAAPEARFVMAGKVHQDHGGYAEALRAAAPPNLRWDAPPDGLPAAAIQAMHADAAFAYLPFPDGATETSSSIPLAQSAGALVITTRGPHTTPALEEHCVFADTPQDVAGVVEHFRNRPGEYLRRIEAARGMVARKLEDTVARTEEMYAEFASRSPVGRRAAHTMPAVQAR